MKDQETGGRYQTALLPLLLGLIPVVKLVAPFSVREWGMLLIAVAFMTLKVPEEPNFFVKWAKF